VRRLLAALIEEMILIAGIILHGGILVHLEDVMVSLAGVSSPKSLFCLLFGINVIHLPRVVSWGTYLAFDLAL